PELIDVLARMDAVVRPVVKNAIPLLKLVLTIFVLVAFVLNNAPELIDVLARMDAVVRPVVKNAVPLVKLV
ncbi:MAG: hypothetical protein EBZ49_09055, partial [Proteobacteria bacterium]|nr:hypothetical protein [Pseudomonadota bacterium]